MNTLSQGIHRVFMVYITTMNTMNTYEDLKNKVYIG